MTHRITSHAVTATDRDRLDRAMRALDRAHALAEGWSEDPQPITRAEAAETLWNAIDLNLWTETGSRPALHALPTLAEETR